MKVKRCSDRNLVSGLPLVLYFHLNTHILHDMPSSSLSTAPPLHYASTHASSAQSFTPHLARCIKHQEAPSLGVNSNSIPRKPSTNTR